MVRGMCETTFSESEGGNGLCADGCSHAMSECKQFEGDVRRTIVKKIFGL